MQHPIEPVPANPNEPLIEHALDRLTPLVEPARRRVFTFVAESAVPVSRDDVARATGLSLALATFHLEKLLEAGLLEAEFQKPATGATRRRGRPAKLYRAAAGDIALSLPDRNYRLAAELLAEALPKAVEAAVAGLDEVARRRGREMGRSEQAGEEATEMHRVTALLARKGYRPRLRDGRVELGNCVFEALTQAHGALMCPANLALLAGILEGAGVSAYEARMEPGDGRCCVVIAPKPAD